MKAGRKLAAALQRLRIRRMNEAIKVRSAPATIRNWPPYLRLVVSNDRSERR